MAGGPIFPRSAYPVTAGLVYPLIYAGAGDDQHEEMLGVTDATTMSTTDCTWRLRFSMPPALPTGTCKARILALNEATSGLLECTPKHAFVAVDEDPSDASLTTPSNVEFNWTTPGASDDEYLENKVTLTGCTASQELIMDLMIDASETTVNSETGLIVSIIWE